MKYTLISLLIVALLSTTSLSAGTLPAGFTETLIAQGLDPTDLAILHDGRIFITIKSGKVSVIENGVLRSTPLINIEGRVDNFNERGLGHILLDPQFESNGFIYLYYTVKSQNHNRLSRFKVTGNIGDPASELILYEFDNLAGTIHNAGDMVFGRDGKLYISTGEGSDSNQAQSMVSSLGKVLRLNSDGTIPSDNPFASTTLGKYKAIYALGFRNPFSMDVDPESGNLFLSDVGGSSFEEANKVESGKNYGWPTIEGMRTTQGLPTIGVYSDPFYTYPHGSGLNAGCAVLGAAFYTPMTNQFPAEYAGKFFFSDYCNGYIKYLDPNDRAMVPIVFAENVDRPVAMAVDHDGNLFYIARGGLGGGSEGDNTSSNNGTLWKVSYNGFGTPAISVPPQNTLVSVGETATFVVSASGAIPLEYQWQIGGNPVPGATAATFIIENAQLADDGKKISCAVTNNLGSIVSAEATLSVTDNKRPEPQIAVTLPNGATLYQGGSILSISGSAIDPENGALAAADLSWTIHFHHDAHFHPAITVDGVSELTYEVPKIGETSSNVWYRVYITAKDHGNPVMSKTIYTDVFPLKTNITVNTVPTKLDFLLDGQTIASPFTFAAVVNMTRTLEGPLSQIRNDSLFAFNHWSEGTERLITFDVPASEKRSPPHSIPLKKEVARDCRHSIAMKTKASRPFLC